MLLQHCRRDSRFSPESPMDISFHSGKGKLNTFLCCSTREHVHVFDCVHFIQYMYLYNVCLNKSGHKVFVSSKY